MADKQDFEIDGKLLSQLRVVDLKQELEKRGLPKSGSKKDLLDRLKVQLQLEKLQQSVTQDEGHVPNLALQDDAIGEQSDIIKEYLAKQQEVYELQKQARRRVEMEEEEEELKKTTKSARESHDSSAESESTQTMSAIKPDGRLTTEQIGEKEPDTESKQEAQSESEENLSTDRDRDNITKRVQEASLGLNLSLKETPQSVLARDDDEKNDSSVEISEPIAKAESCGGNETTVDRKEECSVDGGDKNVATTSGEKTNEESGKNDTSRTLRPRLRRDVFLTDSSTKKIDDTKEKESSTLKSEQVSSSKKHDDDDTVRSRLRNRTKLQRETSSCSSSSSTSQSPGVVSDKKAAVTRESSSNSSSSRDESPSESVSSNGTSDVKTSRFKTQSESRQYGDEEPSCSPPSSTTESQTKKRTRLNRSRGQMADDDVSWQRVTPTENSQDVITTQIDEEIEAKADENDIMEIDKPANTANIRDTSMDVDTKSDETNDNTISETDKDDVVKPPTRVHMRKLSLSSSKETSQSKDNLESPSEGEKPVRKRKWGSTSATTTKKASITISTDSLKDLIPDVKPLSSLLGTENTIDFNEGPTSDAEDSKDVNTVNKDVRIVRTVTQDVLESEKQTFQSDGIKIDDKTVIATKPPLSLMEEPTGRQRSPSPARNPVSRIIHIRNLVRPFTINQLKELLGRTGTLVDGGFWTDKIKSKCYATYESQEQAVVTRQALHGSQWPPSNRKNLIVDYADEDELQFHMSLTDPVEIPKQVRETEPPLREPVRRTREIPIQAPKPKDQKPAPPPPPIREWDRVKIGERSPGERERRKRAGTPPSNRVDKKRERGHEVREKRDKKDRKKEDEEAPAKLLDDLFKKTKSTPCIYWLPLTIEQIKQREEDRKQRQLEREKRRQQIKKEAASEKDKTTGAPVMREIKNVKRLDESRSRKRSESPARNRSRKR